MNTERRIDQTSIDVFDLPYFLPECPLPMMLEHELQDMAASIKRDGLLRPVVLAEVDGELKLVDGRCRLEACRLAGVTPTCTVLVEGEDLRAYFWSVNILRQDRNRSQHWMALAIHDPDSDRDADLSEVTKEGVRQARQILKNRPAEVEGILSGYPHVAVVYQDILAKRAEATEHTKALDQVLHADPPMHELVIEEVLSLEEALGLLVARGSLKAEDITYRPPQASTGRA